MRENNTYLSRRASERGAGSTRLVVGLLTAVTVFYLLISSMMDSGAYFLTVDEVHAGIRESGRQLRLKGNVAFGSHEHETGGLLHRFTVEGEAQRIPVSYEGPLPDVFKEGGEVVATGRFNQEGLFVASEVTAKCPSKYEAGSISEETRRSYQLDHPPEEGLP